MSINDIHRSLYDRFHALSIGSSRSIYFIEHGISTTDFVHVVDSTTRFLSEHKIGESVWDGLYLPLVVVASEVGYQYRGAGTDFWPLLESKLSTNLDLMERRRVRDLFKKASIRFHGATPPDTKWANSFKLISWPITHALLPLEFHRAFAITLARIGNLTDMSDESVYSAIVNSTTLPSERFVNFLKDKDLIVGLTRNLMLDQEKVTEPQNGFSPEIMSRILTDLNDDQVARRNLARMRSNQIIQTHPRTLKVVNKPTNQLISGTLQLRTVGKHFILEGQFPSLEEPTATRVRRSLRQRRYAPRLWGVARVPSDRFLSGLPFVLQFDELPDIDTPLFPNIESAGIDDEDMKVLSDFELSIVLPILFSVNSEGDVGRQIRGKEISANGRYWCLVDSTKITNESIRILGRVGPYKCLELNPKQSASESFLIQLGYSLRAALSLMFGGAPAVNTSIIDLTYSSGDFRLIASSTRDENSKLEIDYSGSTITLSADEIARLTVSKGEHILKVSNGSVSREFTICGITEPPRRQPPIEISIACSDMTIQSLLGGRMSFIVDSLVPVNGLHLSVSISMAGQTYTATGPIGLLPIKISTDHPILRCLFDEDVKRLLMVHMNAIVRISVDGLATAEWRLERKISPCWWDISSNGTPKLESEEGCLPIGLVNAAEPYAVPILGQPAIDDICLLTPMLIDDLHFGSQASFTTLCVAPDRAPLSSPITIRPQLLRRRRAQYPLAGLEDLVDGYLRWSLADSVSNIAEWKRRQITNQLDEWIAEICCGLKWTLYEAEVSRGNPWNLLKDFMETTDVGRDTYIEVPDDLSSSILDLTIEQIQKSIPDLWERVSPHVELESFDYKGLDLACLKAYELLAIRYTDSGNLVLASILDSADPANSRDEWNAVLQSVVEVLDLWKLAGMITPTNMLAPLTTIDFKLMHVEEVVDVLHLWVNDAAKKKALAGACPTRETVKALYTLWVDPEQTISLDWRGALNTALVELCVARAIRYVALRTRAVVQGAYR